jgi:integrase
MRKQLTEAMLEKLTPPKAGRLEIFDTIVPAMAVRVTANGAKTFVVRGRVRGHSAPIRVTVGDATGMKLKDAREAASDILKGFRAGVDPRETRKAEKLESHLGEALKWERVAETFIEKHAKKNRTWRQSEALLAQKVTPAWKGRLITEITRADVVALLDKVEDQVSLYQANRVLATIRKLFNWAMLRGLISTSPIVAGMAREGEATRTRYLTMEEVAIIWRACERVGQPFGPLFQFMLATGQRRGEAAGARWASIDLERDRLWTLSPEETKAARTHLVPLTDLALELLAAQPRIGEAATLVFTTTGDTPVSGFSRGKAALDAEVAMIMREDAKARGDDPDKVKPLPAWRLHDLRRTVATHLEDALGVPPHIVGSVLNHAPTGYKGVTAVYTRGDLIFARRRALVAWARLLRLAVDGGETWQTVAAILRPETEAEAARTEEMRRMIQADEATWKSYRDGLVQNGLATNVRPLRGVA